MALKNHSAAYWLGIEKLSQAAGYQVYINLVQMCNEHSVHGQQIITGNEIRDITIQRIKLISTCKVDCKINFRNTCSCLNGIDPKKTRTIVTACKLLVSPFHL